MGVRPDFSTFDLIGCCRTDFDGSIAVQSFNQRL